MNLSYDPLFRTLDRLGKRPIDLVRECKLATGTVAKFAKNESVGLDIIARVCIYLDVPIEEVVRIENSNKINV